jgi:hypothetical protein
MESRDLAGLADRGQIDRPVPGKEQANMTLDRTPRMYCELDPERVEALLQGALERIGEVGKVLDARRERFSLTAQALLLWVCPPPSVRAAPGVVMSRTAGWVGLP